MQDLLRETEENL